MMREHASAIPAADATPDEDADRVEEMDDLDVGTALMAALGSRDMGEPSVELNLGMLTPAERRAVLNLLRRQLELGEAVRQATGRNPETVGSPFGGEAHE